MIISTTTIVGAIIWLVPFILYMVLFRDPPAMRIVWSLVTILFTWVGLLVRFIFGIVVRPNETILTTGRTYLP